ncbi:MAG: hypothetical protein ACI8UO_006573 [Verrucomicrobiales bacterium]|jgi:hypothetical protein
MTRFLLSIGFCVIILGWSSICTAQNDENLRKVLMDTILPSVDLEDVPLPEALEWFGNQMLERASSKLTIEVIRPEDLGRPAEDAPKISLRLTNVPAIEALRYITVVARMDFRLWNGRIVILPMGIVAGEKTLHIREANEALIWRLTELGVPTIDEYEGTPSDPDARTFLDTFLSKNASGGKLHPVDLSPLGLKAQVPGEFAMIVRSKWGPAHLVMFDEPDTIALIDIGLSICYSSRKRQIEDALRIFEGATPEQKLERALKLAMSREPYFYDSMDLRGLYYLASLHEKLELEPERFELEPDQVEPEKKRMRQRMSKLVERYIETLHFHAEMLAEEPDFRRQPIETAVDPLADQKDPTVDPFAALDALAPYNPNPELNIWIVAEDGTRLAIKEPMCELSRVIKGGDDPKFEGWQLGIRSIESAKEIYNFTKERISERFSVVVNNQTVARPTVAVEIGNGAILIKFGTAFDLRLLESVFDELEVRPFDLE